MSLYELRMQVKDIEPPVWRELRLRGDTTLAELHEVLQVAMGWTNSHLYLFHAGGKKYGEPDPEWEKVQDSARTTLEDLVTEAGRSLVYEYDLGDRWIHEITVSGPVEAAGDERPRCIGGARACPPEDCGGPYRYRDLLEAISDPRHEDHDELLDWVGDDFDPEAFDARSVDAALGQMR